MLKNISLNPAISNTVTKFQNLTTQMNTVSTGKNEFNSQLMKDTIHLDNDILNKMDELLQNVDEVKMKIQNELTVENVMEYKDAIKSFLNFYVDNMITYQDVSTKHPKYGYNQKMTIIQETNKKVDELDDVMSLIDTRTGSLDMLDKIGEINGMILNLVL